MVKEYKNIQDNKDLNNEETKSQSNYILQNKTMRKMDTIMTKMNNDNEKLIDFTKNIDENNDMNIELMEK